MKKTFIFMALVALLAIPGYSLAKTSKCPVVPPACAQVITFAINPSTGEIVAFPTPCDVPPGWVIVPPPSLEE